MTPDGVDNSGNAIRRSETFANAGPVGHTNHPTLVFLSFAEAV